MFCLILGLQIMESDVESDCSTGTTPQRALAPLEPSGTPQCAAYMSAAAVVAAAAAWGPTAATAAAAFEATAGSSGAALCTTCSPGMFGADCTAVCSDDDMCRGRGFCDGQGRCVCFFPFTGLTCDKDTTDLNATLTSLGNEGCDTAAATDPVAAVLQPVGYLDGLRAANLAAAEASTESISSVSWEGDSLVLGVGKAVPAWRIIQINLPSSAGIRVPKNGIDVNASKSALTAFIRSESATVVSGGPMSIAPSAPRLRCQSVVLQVPGNGLCSGAAVLRVCAPNMSAATMFAEQIGLPSLLTVSEDSCAGPCPPGASWTGPDRQGCCGAGVGGGDFAFCATDRDCVFESLSLGLTVTAAGVPLVTQQCCSECERLAAQSICGDSEATRATELCRQSGCAESPPCAGRAMTAVTGPLNGQFAPAEVMLASGAGLQIPAGVWPVADAATVKVLTGQVSIKAFPAGSPLKSDILEFGPSGLTFPEPGIIMVFALSDSDGPPPGRTFHVFRLTNGVFTEHKFPPTFVPASTNNPAYLLVKTLSFSVYAAFDVPLPSPVLGSSSYSNGSFTTPPPTNVTEVIVPPPQPAGTISWAAIGAGIGGAVVLLVAATLISYRIRSKGRGSVDGTDVKIAWTKETPLKGTQLVEAADQEKRTPRDVVAAETSSTALSKQDASIGQTQLQAPTVPASAVDYSGLAADMEETEPDMKQLENGPSATNGYGRSVDSAPMIVKKPTDRQAAISASHQLVIKADGRPSISSPAAAAATNLRMIESRPSLAAPTAAAAAAIKAAVATKIADGTEDSSGIVVSRMQNAEASADMIVLEHWRQEDRDSKKEESLEKGRHLHKAFILFTCSSTNSFGWS
jgi:hypothetical protein